MSVNRNLPTECLLNNIIDEDMQAVLRPMIIFQKMFLVSRFVITNNFITPINRRYYIKSLIGFLIWITLNFYRFSLSTAKNAQSSIYLIFMEWFNFFYFMVTTIIIYFTSARQSENTVLLIMKIQNAVHSINMNKHEYLFKTKLWNWINIIGVFVGYVTLVLIGAVIIGNLNSATVFTIIFFPLIIFDLNIVYVSRTITFINNVLEMWNTKMINIETGNANRFQERDENNENVGKSMLNAYKDLVKAFCIAGKVSQFAISYLTLTTFLSFLLAVQSVIEYGKMKDTPEIVKTLSWTFSSLWCAKNVGILCNLCIPAEKMYNNVRIAEITCARILASGDSDLHRMCKNVLRFNRCTFRKLSAIGGIVDAALPPRMLTIVVTYTVVLLQFAFL